MLYTNDKSVCVVLCQHSLLSGGDRAIEYANRAPVSTRVYEMFAGQVIGQRPCSAVALGEQRRADRPGHAGRWIAPQQAALVSRAVQLAGFVEHFGFVAQHAEAVSKPGRNI